MYGVKINEAILVHHSNLPAEMQSELEDALPDPEAWMTTPHEMLGGRTPLDVSSSGEKGREIVWNLIRLLKSGSFS